MLFFVLGIVFKQESLIVYVDGLGTIHSLYNVYASDDRIRVDKFIKFKADTGVSPLMARFIEGSKTEMYDLVNGKALFINHDDSTYREVSIDEMYDIEENFRETDEEVFKNVSFRRDSCYHIHASGNGDSLNIFICTQPSDGGIYSKLKSVYGKLYKLMKWDMPIHIPTTKFINFAVFRSTKLIKALKKVKGFPHQYSLDYYKGDRLMFSIHSRILKLEEVDSVSFSIPEGYKRR